MQSILFLCTGNSCRSQMAHGFASAFLNDEYKIYSAGIESHGLNKLAVKAMAEANIDISHHQSETLAELDTNKFDYVFAVCDHAADNCPTFSADTEFVVRRFDDPPKLAKSANSEEDALVFYRQVRDQIKQWVQQLPQQLALTTPSTNL